MFENKFVNFVSFICLFGQTHNKERETLCLRVCEFVFCLNSLHQLLMLGPKQPYGIKSMAKRGLGSSRQRIMGLRIEELSTGQLQQDGSPWSMSFCQF